MDARVRPGPSWQDRLVDIYGPERSRAIEPLVADVLAKGTRDDRGGELWSERDVWLITYPDQFRRNGERPLQTLRGFYIQHLADLFYGLHVLPFFPASSDGGYSITDHTAVDVTLGTWQDIEALAGVTRLMVDAVINHASVQGDWFQRWSEGDPDLAHFFRTAQPDADLSSVVRAREHPLLTSFTTSRGEEWVWTTFSADQADLDYRNPDVLLSVLQTLIDYVEHGVQMIRLDAIGFLWKEEGSSSVHLPQTHQIIQFLRASLTEACPGTMLVTEANVPHTENISYLGTTVPEAHAVYQFPLPPLTLHAYASEDATTLGDWLAENGSPPADTTFVNFLASHDGVGLRPAEDILSPRDIARLVDLTQSSGGRVSSRSVPGAEASPYELNATWYDLVRGPTEGDDALQRHLGSHAIMLSIAGIPAIYVHSVYASSNDLFAVDEPGGPRAINRQKMDAESLSGQLHDPSTRAAQAAAGLAEMLELRRSSAAFHPDAAQEIMNPAPNVLSVSRVGSDGSAATVLVNVSDVPTTVPTPSAGRAHGRRFEQDNGVIRLGPWGYAWVLSAKGETGSNG